nr:hypothetical protein [Phaeosphaeriaceae sp. CF-150626]
MSFEPNWLVQIPDQPTPEALQARQNNVAAHLAHNKTHVQEGRIVMSGPMVTAHSNSATPKGSVMVWKADSEADLRDQLSKDPFVALGVWNIEKATIVPFLCAVCEGERTEVRVF